MGLGDTHSMGLGERIVAFFCGVNRTRKPDAEQAAELKETLAEDYVDLPILIKDLRGPKGLEFYVDLATAVWLVRAKLW